MPPMLMVAATWAVGGEGQHHGFGALNELMLP
eukprot:CAMPEP_0175912674 /NCGR_PEP_ID=MMETSP0108-20121206/8854_1 /TAXON_ID=195067 ORGANISM="Goniomonas pacifica, Strain CCMP1869" /NCGR_SAMPLE_ID=MMETSP0108 /ASSEMBLY_ACC=CAM_ASM_000204 /LENGTH=31 /DNA_ID= /DNA_START= /DNA_END= /DNA_ORIENTATION=